MLQLIHLKIVLRHLNVAEGQADTEIVCAKFVIGADGKVNLCGYSGLMVNFIRCSFMGPQVV